MVTANGAGPRQGGTGARNHEMVIQTHELTKVFLDNSGVRNLSLAVPRGVLFGFIGPSGCGKTTTVRLLTGIYRPNMGHVQVLGHEPWRFSTDLRARIGYMPQQFILYPDLTVWENLNFAASIYGVGLLRRRRLRDVLDFVDLAEHAGKLVRNISGGMQRRLSLAATLVHDPELLFLDEPTAGVDPVLRRRFWDHFQAMRQHGRTLFVTTQYVSEAAYCDIVGVMANGQLLHVDTPKGLRLRAYGGEIVHLQTKQRMSQDAWQRLHRLPFLVRPSLFTTPTTLRITVSDAAKAIPALMAFCQTQNIGVESLQEYMPPFDDVFVELVKEEPVRA